MVQFAGIRRRREREEVRKSGNGSIEGVSDLWIKIELLICLRNLK